MKNLIAAIAIGLALVVGASIGGYFLYEQHISSDVRAAVQGEFGNNVSNADALAYLRAATLASRTKRDAYIVGLLDKAIEQSRLASDHQRESLQLLTKDRTPEDCNIYGWGSAECRLAIPQSVAEWNEYKKTIV
jgi:hypothetical protein